MKLKKYIAFFVAGVVLMNYTACSDSDENGIAGLTVSNFPVMDGSNSTRFMRTVVADELLGIDYSWSDLQASSSAFIASNWTIRHESGVVLPHYLFSGTHEAFLNLIDGNADLILTIRQHSAEELAYAKQKGVSLLETPIAQDAFVFMVNDELPVRSLDISQIQGIYTGTYRNWSEVGGNDGEISPYYIGKEYDADVCWAMDSLFMAGQPMLDSSELAFSESSYELGLYCWALRDDVAGIIYGFLCDYNLLTDYGKRGIRLLAVNGIEPTRENIENGTYPYVTPVYAVIRADEDLMSTTYQVYDKLVHSGTSIIEASRFIPIDR